jgi:hypothetical protein
MKKSSPIRGWIPLFRPPNLLTVPGDVMAGYVLAAQSAVFPWAPLGKTMMASLCFYMAGLALNDYADRENDALERPSRPLPSGAVSPAAARAAGLALLLAGLAWCAWAGSAALWLGVSLAVTIGVYTFYLKEAPGAGALLMGLCRAQNVALGALALPVLHAVRPDVWVAVCVIGAYVSSVSVLARRETQRHHPGVEVGLPCVVLVLGLLFYVPWLPDAFPARAGFLVAYGLAIVSALRFGLRMSGLRMTPDLAAALERKERTRHEMPHGIGQLIAALLFVQAAFIFSAADGLVNYTLAALLLVAYPLNRLASRFFYAS